VSGGDAQLQRFTPPSEPMALTLTLYFECYQSFSDKHAVPLSPMCSKCRILFPLLPYCGIIPARGYSFITA
jgi:hypothetical protein